MIRCCVHDLPALMLVLLLSGCAVMRVDVDVYKGPLANHEEVQMEQFAVMAIGAKPLLVHLRDTLEWGSDPKVLKAKRAACTWWKPDYVDQKEAENGSSCDQRFFSEPQAQRLNRVLWLYEDKDIPPGQAKLQRLVNEGQAAFDLYVDAKKAFDEISTDATDEEQSKAYVAARVQVSKMWQLAIDTMLLLQTPEYKTIATKQGIDTLATIISSLTQPRSVAVAMYLPGMHSLRDSLESQLGKKFWKQKKWETPQYTEAARAVRDAIRKSPKDISLLLVRAHRALIGASPLVITEDVHPLHEKFARLVSRQYGIARGPSFTTSDAIERWKTFANQRAEDQPELSGDNLLSGFEEIIGQFNESKLGQGTFDKGRLREGIETLIDEYLEAADRSGSSSPRVNKQKERLILALVRFAEKMLFIANNDSLISEASKNAEINRYVLVLQAIGNSLLNQADELRHRGRHKDNLDDAGKSETWAAETSKLVKQDDFDKRPEANNQRKVLDDMIAVLRYRLLKSQEDHGSDHAETKQIQAALKTAFEHRSGMAYIRPSGAYLRSSLAATTLQSDPKLTWENMLTNHAIRSLPGAHSSGDQVKQEILRDIDKQFWQNINSVRVAGAGNTNYVVVKDDIGNWYIKKFAADPQPIIRSAQQLALYGAGGALNANLLRRQEL